MSNGSYTLRIPDNLIELAEAKAAEAVGGGGLEGEPANTDSRRNKTCSSSVSSSWLQSIRRRPSFPVDPG
jgi:hypothetical protein